MPRCSAWGSSSPRSWRRRARGCATRPRSGRRSSRRRPGSRRSRTSLKARILELRAPIQDDRAAGQGSAPLVRELNDQLEEARIAAGLIPLTGTGIVLQLEDSTEPSAPGANEADYLVGAHDLRTVVEELWVAGAEAIAVNGERITPTTAIIDIGPSILVNCGLPRAAVPGHGDRPGRPVHAVERVARLRRLRPRTRRGVRHPGLVRGARDVDMPAFAGTVTLRYARPGTASAEPAPAARAATRRAADPMHVRRNQLTIAAVAFVLGPARRRPAPDPGRRRRPSPACPRRT